jgi:RES domain-containing protein
MDLRRTRVNLRKVIPRPLIEELFVRAYNTETKTRWRRDYFFDCTWSFQRGYRFNFKKTHPVLYLASDQLVASSEIGARTRSELLVPHLQSEADPYLYVTIKVTAHLLDLTDGPTRRRLGVKLEELLIRTRQWDDDMDRGVWSVTHHLGKLALEDERFDGIIYPAQPADELLGLPNKENVAIFMNPSLLTMSRPLHPSVKLEVVDKGHALKRFGLRF